MVRSGYALKKLCLDNLWSCITVSDNVDIWVQQVKSGKVIIILFSDSNIATNIFFYSES